MRTNERTSGCNVKKKIKKSSQEGICQLCGCQGKLCEAHIIPKSLKHLVGGRGSTFVALEIVPIEKSNFASKATKAHATQNFDFDKTILCSQCDNNILGIYDKILIDFYKKYIKLSNTQTIIKDISIETDKRLYFGFLSTLYRASITSIKKQYIYIPENYKQLLRFSLFDKTLEYISDHFRIYFRGHRCDFSSKLIHNIHPGPVKDEQYTYLFSSFGLDVIFLIGNIERTRMSNILNSACEYKEVTLLRPNEGLVNIHFSTEPSQLTKILLSVERPFPSMKKKIGK